MNISLVTETFPPEINGVAMTLKRIVEGLGRLGESVTVVRPRQPAVRENQNDERLYVDHLVPGIPLPRYEGLMMGIPVSGRLLRRWARERPDVVHIATEGPLGWSALAAAAKLGIPVSSSFHTNWHQYGKHYGYGLLLEGVVSGLRVFHNQTAATMVPTHQMRTELTARGFQNVVVVSRGVDTELFSPERRSEELRHAWGAAPQDTVVIYVGRIAPEKNINLAVESFEAIRGQNSRARFVLVGEGPDRETLRNRHPDYHFAGMRRGEDLAAHYASGDVFLFPSITETFGNVVTEALASGLVVVGYDYAAGREHIRPGENGVLARFDDPAAFRNASIDIGARPDAWPAMRAAARQTALGVTWDAIVRKFRETLAKVAATGATGEEIV